MSPEGQRILDFLRGVSAERALRRADAKLGSRTEAIKHWQHRPCMLTYADLLASPQHLVALRRVGHQPERTRRAQLQVCELKAPVDAADDQAFFTPVELERAHLASRGAYVPLAFAPGEAFQFDWSEDWLVFGRKKTKLQIAHTKLCHSRAFHLRAYLTQTHEMLFDAHNHAFRVLGGIPERGIYDNMKTAVDKVGRGKERLVNARFRAMVSHFLFEAEFCNPAAGWEKGQIEKNVRDARLRLLQDANDKARLLATLYIEDVGGLIKEAITPHFGFSRYAEKLGMSAHSFAPLDKALRRPENVIEAWLIDLLKDHMERFRPGVVGITIPFPQREVRLLDAA